MVVTSAPTPDSKLDLDRDDLWAAARGDEMAFESFVIRHEASVYRFVQSLGSVGADADDALQETFIHAWRAASTYQGTGSARAWLLSIARHVVYRAGRRHAGEPAEFDSLESIAQRAGWGDESEVRARADDRARVVQDALQRLSVADREILVLREIQELSGDDTAAALQLSLPAMKSRLHRARLRLTSVLRETFRNEDLA